MNDTSKPRVAVLSGGRSPERDVSLAGGKAVSAALEDRGFPVVRLDPRELDVTDFDWKRGDVAFLVLHGEFGEDGQVQTQLDALGIPYTGSGPEASRLAFSKSATKERLRLAGIPTPESVVIRRGDSLDSLLERAERLGFPLVVKPDAQGSSLGVSVVHKPMQLPAALARCFALDGFGLLEKYVAGSEWTIGLLNNDALPPICIETPRGFYDYDAKYADEETQYLFETTVPESVLRELQSLAVGVGRAVGTRGIARVDFRLDGDLKPWVLEVNTIPGMTDHSLIPKAFARMGISFPQLCERIVLETLNQNTAQRAA